jgi:hypothetical protein
MAIFKEIQDVRLQSRIQTRYVREIRVLEVLGFKHLAFKLEMRSPFSLLAYFPLLPLMRRTREILVFPFPLRIASASILLTHPEPSTIASCMGLGVRFYTNFSDHFLLISSTVLGHAHLQGTRRSDSQIVRTLPCLTVQRAWSSHKNQVAEMRARGHSIATTQSFTDYIEISEREGADLRQARSSKRS